MIEQIANYYLVAPAFQVVGTLFTHHQKCVIVDTQASGNHRKITAFIGGLDLCDGRYDTPEHRLFRDLDTVYKDDYHNPTIPVSIYIPGNFFCFKNNRIICVFFLLRYW
jgi:hypothetical protein